MRTSVIGGGGNAAAPRLIFERVGLGVDRDALTSLPQYPRLVFAGTLRLASKMGIDLVPMRDLDLAAGALALARQIEPGEPANAGISPDKPGGFSRMRGHVEQPFVGGELQSKPVARAPSHRHCERSRKQIT